jgi:tetratricopeptide (TPR) repeat protein
MAKDKDMRQTRTGPEKAGAGFAVRGRRPSWPGDQGLALLLALLALALRIAYLLESAGNPFRHHLNLDPKNYHQWALMILGGTPFGPDPFMQAPLYPYFLAGLYAIFGTSTITPLWIQAILGAATTYLGARIAGEHWGRAGLVATGLILALYKPAIFYTGILLVPALATFLLACALFTAARRSLLSGVFIGLTGLAHPTMLLGGLLAALGLVRGRRRILALVVGAFAVIVPATIHNFVMSGHLVPMSANVGINLYVGNGPEANGFYVSPFGMRGERDPLGIAEAARQAGKPLTMVEASRFWTQRTLETVRAEPVRAAGLFLQKLHCALGAYEAPQIESLDFEKRYAALLRFPLLPNWILLLSLSGGALVLLARERFAWTLAGGVLITALVIAVFFVTARFRLPAHLFMALAVGGGVATLVSPGRLGPAPRMRLIRAFVVTAAVAAVFAPNWLAIGREATFGQYHNRLGLIAELEGRTADAIAEYTAALEIDPNVARASINLGILKARARDFLSAERYLQHGIAMDPRSSRGYLALGQLRELEGNLDAACSLYARSWAADTTFLPGLEFLAVGRYMLGDTLASERLARGVVQRAAGGTQGARCAFILDRMAERRRFGWQLQGPRQRARADIALAMRNLDAAEELYRQAARANSGELVSLLELARIATVKGERDAAEGWVTMFLQRGGPIEATGGLPGGADPRR